MVEEMVWEVEPRAPSGVGVSSMGGGAEGMLRLMLGSAGTRVRPVAALVGFGVSMREPIIRERVKDDRKDRV